MQLLLLSLEKQSGKKKIKQREEYLKKEEWQPPYNSQRASDKLLQPPEKWDEAACSILPEPGPPGCPGSHTKASLATEHSTNTIYHH